MHRVLTLSRGTVLSERALRRVLAGLGGPNRGNQPAIQLRSQAGRSAAVGWLQHALRGGARSAPAASRAP
jgi:hypothetical protein